MRKIQQWNDHWLFEGAGAAQTVSLPHIWKRKNVREQADRQSSRKPWRGTCWYRKSFPRPSISPGEELWLEIHGISNMFQVYLNGRLLRTFGVPAAVSRFYVNLTDGIENNNDLAIAMGNEENTQLTFCFPGSQKDGKDEEYSGFFQDVYLITVPHEHFAMEDGGTGMDVTCDVSGDRQDANVRVETHHNASRVAITCDGQTIVTRKAAVFTIAHPRLWDGRGKPWLYTVTATLRSGDTISKRFCIEPEGTA